MDVLSPKQNEILSFLINFQNDRGYAPSVREICEAVRLSSTSSVHNHLSKLEEKGFIKRDPARPRSVEILKQPDANSFVSPVRAKIERTFSYPDAKRTSEIVAVPIIGRVRAGEPILAVQNIEDYYPLPVSCTQNADCFMLRVQGESMIEAGIMENDLILVKSQRSASDRDIVVALLGDSVTVKTFYKEKSFIRLQPENRRMNPILVKDCQILGKVIGLVRMMNL